MEIIANLRLCLQPTDLATQLNGLSPSMKKEADSSAVTFVSTLAHRAQSLSPQKQKQKSLLQAGFNLSTDSDSSSSAYQHSPYHSGRDKERSFRVVSSAIPQKRKSQSAEGSDLNDSSDDDSSQPFIIQNGIGSSSKPQTFSSFEKKPATVPKTPSPQPQLPPPDSVSVVIPSPSAARGGRCNLNTRASASDTSRLAKKRDSRPSTGRTRSPHPMVPRSTKRSFLLP